MPLEITVNVNFNIKLVQLNNVQRINATVYLVVRIEVVDNKCSGFNGECQLRGRT